MMKPPSRRSFVSGSAAVFTYGLTILTGFGLRQAQAADRVKFEVMHTEDEWRKLLSPNQFAVLRHAGTERPFSSPLHAEHREGRFICGGCALELFSSKTKFESGTGWPSFWQPLDKAVVEHTDTSLGMARTEVACRRCGGHLGHVFNDGPKPTGLRYCMNGIAMAFKPGAA
jgi:peptide-methionine (R)-S-oxide reductase